MRDALINAIMTRGADDSERHLHNIQPRPLHKRIIRNFDSISRANIELYIYATVHTIYIYTYARTRPHCCLENPEQLHALKLDEQRATLSRNYKYTRSFVSTELYRSPFGAFSCVLPRTRRIVIRTVRDLLTCRRRRRRRQSNNRKLAEISNGQRGETLVNL